MQDHFYSAYRLLPVFTPLTDRRITLQFIRKYILINIRDFSSSTEKRLGFNAFKKDAITSNKLFVLKKKEK